MKKSLFILLLSLFAALKTYAYDAKVGAIYYNFSGAEAQVTYKKMEHLHILATCSSRLL